MAAGINGYLASAVMRITIDGGAAINKTVGSSGATTEDQSLTIPFFFGFSTSVKVEMQLGAVGTSRYWAVSLVE